MRNAFANEITELAGKYPELVLLTGDMGNKLFDEYKLRYPDRFYNCGVAEANMTSVAAGLAMCGLKPVTYSIAPFNTLRCLEQIKIDICYHKLPVIVVGVGAGLSYAELGPTHQSCEDISLMRSLPGMTVVCPGDAVEVRLALKSAIALGKPVYLRLGKKNEPVVHKHEPDFSIGKAIVAKKGSDMCLLSTGNTFSLADEIVKNLDKKGISVELVSMHTVKPLDNDLLNTIFKKFPVVATIEEHSRIGGIGAALEEWLFEHGLNRTVELIKFACHDRFINLSCNQKNARNISGLTIESVVNHLWAKWNK